MSKFWPNSRPGPPNRFPTQIVFDCFVCDEAFIGDITYCPHCHVKLVQLYPFHGVGVKECLAAIKGR